MKLVQARVPETEYQLLRRRAKAEGKSLQEVVREALRARLLPDRIEPDDPLFRMFPLVPKRGPAHRISEEHDRILYGLER